MANFHIKQSLAAFISEKNEENKVSLLLFAFFLYFAGAHCKIFFVYLKRQLSFE